MDHQDRSAFAGIAPRRVVRWLTWGLAIVSLATLLQAFDVRGALQQIARARPGWIIAAILANFALLPLMTEQWSRLLPAPSRRSWRDLWHTVTLAMAAMNTVPFGGGHAVAVGALARRGAPGVSAAVSLLALEQVCEGAAKLVLLMAALCVAPLPDPLQRVAWILAGVLIATILMLCWIARHPTSGAGSHRCRARWAKHLDVLKRPARFSGAIALSLAMKVCELIALYAVQRSLEIELPIATAPLVLAVVTFASLISITPGNLGVYEAAALGVYQFLGLSASDAVALGLVQHACFLFPVIGTGYVLNAWRAFFGTPSALAGAR